MFAKYVTSGIPECCLTVSECHSGEKFWNQKL